MSRQRIRASYREAIEWVAMYDDPMLPGCLDADEVAKKKTVQLIADLYGKHAIEIAFAVVKKRAGLSRKG